MSKQKIIDLLTANYNSFVDYINSLTAEEYSFSNRGKWTGGQQLDHVILCVKPLVQVFSMDKSAIEKTFGRTDRAGRTYEVLLGDYLEKLNDGGKAPSRFVPETSSPDQKKAQCELLAKLVKELCARIETFSDQELDTLLIPHPLLGNLTLREMLYNAAYHVKHHQLQTEENLKKQVAASSM